MLFSCDTNNVCSPYSDRIIKLSFFVNSGKSEKDTTVRILTAYGIGAKDTAYKNVEKIGSMSLSLSQLSDSTRYVFLIDSLYNDTLLLISKHELQMVVENCFSTIFTLIDFQCSKGKAFDSSVLVSGRVRSDILNNIKLYLNHRAKADTTKKIIKLILP